MSLWSWLFPKKEEKAPACPAPTEPVIRAPEIIPVPASDIYFPYRPLFNLFGKSEGTDRGRGYNETLSYGAFTGGDVNLIGMTLKQVDALQTQMLAHPKNKLNSSACGRYQIVRTTLRKLKKLMELPDTAYFNEKMQDHMCLQLLEGRGLSKYLDGSMREDTFLTNLAKEWASIPKPDGKGYYGNQSKTPVTPSEVRAVLAEVKQRIKG
jgi:muramidase (phage lysozyme)